MVNFNNGTELLNKFLGSEKKTTILYNGTVYMLKYPDPIRINSKLAGILSYKNNQYSEHVGSRIFNSCDIEAQDTVLGYFTDNLGKQKTVVGCRDFTQYGSILYEFSKLANQAAVSSGKLNATIENIYIVINDIEIIKDKDIILQGFWDMFVVDALIGNGDRHFGNWGILDNGGYIKLAPAYDCGSSLGALLDTSQMESIIASHNLFKNKEYNITSCYSMGGNRIFYHEIFKNPPQDLSNAILRVVPRIDMKAIHGIVDNTPTMPTVRKAYLKAALDMRYSLIIAPAYKRISKANTMMLHNNNKTRDEAR